MTRIKDYLLTHTGFQLFPVSCMFGNLKEKQSSILCMGLVNGLTIFKSFFVKIQKQITCFAFWNLPKPSVLQYLANSVADQTGVFISISNRCSTESLITKYYAIPYTFTKSTSIAASQLCKVCPVYSFRY